LSLFDLLRPGAAPEEEPTGPSLREPSKGAVIRGAHRYRLWRVADPRKGWVLWVMLNPSTADAREDDPTIRKCLGFSERWGFGGIDVVNVFAYRATDPAVLRQQFPKDPSCPEDWDHARGPENTTWLRQAAREARRIVVAWGGNDTGPWAKNTVNILRWQDGHLLSCLGFTKDGQPRHPLMLAYATPLVPYPTEGDR
jgi:hypothetical protein